MSLNISFIIIIIFYLIGSVPFALILPKLFGLGDIRNIGSGNVGATNVLRTGNKYLAVVVLCLDILKGLVPFLLLNSFFDNIGLLHIILLCHFAIIGHIFPVWLKFKGGKGVAPYIGFLFGINLLLGLSFIILWIIIALISRYSSLSSIVASVIAPIYFLINSNNYISVFLLYLFLLIILKHSKNIKRLIDRTENKIKLFK